MSQRSEQVALQVKDAAADFFNLESNRLSLITVTSADISKDFRNATVYFTVYPSDQEEQALHFARRRRSDFKSYLKSHLSLKRIPFVEFKIDEGEKHRQHIEELSQDF
ncbi:MAG: ribosome-binding factor A [Candidatus Pacebacteria bacterium]|nr:ribosome-binding factor A [Candidatus Paceibacterota bacterium]